MTLPGASNIDRARARAEEVVGSEDCTLREALLADAIGHLSDELALLSERVNEAEGRRIAAAEGRRYE